MSQRQTAVIAPGTVVVAQAVEAGPCMYSGRRATASLVHSSDGTLVRGRGTRSLL